LRYQFEQPPRLSGVVAQALRTLGRLSDVWDDAVVAKGTVRLTV